VNFTIRKATTADAAVVREIWAEAAPVLAATWAKETGVLMQMDQDTALQHIKHGVYLLAAGGKVQAWARISAERLPNIPDRPADGDKAERYALGAARTAPTSKDHVDWQRLFYKTWLLEASTRGVKWVWGSTPAPIAASTKGFVEKWGATVTIHPETGEPLYVFDVAIALTKIDAVKAV